MKIVYSFIVVAACFASGISQSKVIDKNEFDATVQAASENAGQYWIGKPFRLIAQTQGQISNRPESDFASKFVSERDANGSTRTIRESSFGKNRSSGESVSVGGRAYMRNNGGAWELSAEPKNSDAPSAPNPTPISNVLSFEIEYKFLGMEMLKGENARTYLKTERRIEVDTASGNQRTNETTTKYWLAPDGHLMKSNFLSTTKLIDRTIMTKIVLEYELDPSITITAPAKTN